MSDDPSDESSDFQEMMEEQRERRREVRAEISFEECQEIKEAGELYRNTGSVEDVAEELDVDNKEAEELVAKYLTLINHPTEHVALKDVLRGVEFYGKQKPLDELRNAAETPDEQIKKGLREFVGMTLDETDFEDTEISSSNIPEEPVYPPSINDLRDLQCKLRTVVINSQPALNVKESVHALQGVGTMTERMAQTIQESLLPLRESFLELVEQYRARVAEAIRVGISNFEPPDEYDSEAVEVNPLTAEVAMHSLEGFIDKITEEEAESLYPYLPRLEATMEDYTEGHYYTPVYAAISVQDGLMEWLCEQSDKDPSDTNRFGEPYYGWDTKRNILASRYEGWYDVETDEVLPNLEAFYQHRNAIMHGDPLAYFDENIATVSILFLNLTLYTVIDELNKE